ncbi:MAG TPA: DUF4838 domain-containing protein [Phycisphaerae bacterium]|nr:DUF4838 domain-containing protein [Phycisphaerae bacterium]
MTHARTIGLTSALVAFICQQTGAIEIAKDGAGKATIVVVKGSSYPVRHAARELKDHLKKITGADLAIDEAGAAGSPRILVGPKSARLADPDFPAEELGDEGIVIRTVGDDLILAGGEPRGTLYAVYTFLEDHVGCRWWTPDANTIPHKPTLSFEKLDVRYVPPLEYREPFWETAFDRDWAVRNKVNGTHLPLTPQVGGKQVIAGFVHTFYPLIPPDRYFKDHPEWFSEINGQRTHQSAQLCLSNEEMGRELVKNLKELLRKNRMATQTSVSQNDWGGHCQCAKCKAVDAEEGGPSGSILRFVNAVAADIEKEFPKVSISTLAYIYSQSPPKITRPRDNVVIWLCTMNCSYNLPLKSHKRNEGFAQDLIGWGKIAGRLYIWDYTTNFRHYLFVHPNLRVLGPNLRFFVENNVAGVFEQGATGTLGAEMMELRAWVLAKLLWNPNLDDNKLIGEFLDGYFGPAGKHVKAYIDTIHDVMQAGMQPLGCYEEPDRRFMDIEPLTRGWSHLKEAEKAVANDPELLQRVRYARMPMMYAFMIRWADLRKQAEQKNVAWPMGDDPRAVLAEYKTMAGKIGIKRVSEQETFDKLEEKLKLPE